MEGPSENQQEIVDCSGDNDDDSGAHATAKRRRELDDQLESQQKKMKAANDRNIKQAVEVCVAAYVIGRKQ